MVGILILTILGFISGMIIVLISTNQKDINQEVLEKMLPGYNCNACGFGSCKGMAEHAIKDQNCLKKCKPLSKEKYQEIIKEFFMKNKGFTLVELLAVIVIMLVIATIVITSAYSIVNSNKDEQYDVLITEVKQAVRLYLNDNYENYVVGRDFKYLAVKFLNDNSCSKIYIKLKDLVDSNLIKESSLVDPRNNKNINLEKYVEVYYENSNLTIAREFSDTLKNYCDNSNIVYDNNSKNYYIGNTNKYVSLNNQIWKILNVNKDGSIKLLLNDNIGNSVFGQGAAYDSSYVLASIQYWYIYDISTPAKDLIKESSLSLLTDAEYNNLSSNIKGTDEFWIINSNDKTGLTTKGNKDYNIYSAFIKPTIELKSNAIYVSGDGSLSNPYTVR